MKMSNDRKWWPLLIGLFPLVVAGLLKIEAVTNWLWTISEPIRLQHTQLTGKLYPLSFYIQLIQRITFWNSLMIITICVLSLKYKSSLQAGILKLWNETVTLGQLAVYRIIVFAGLLGLIIQNHPASMSLLPVELQDPPWLWGFLKGSIFLEPEFVGLASLFAQATCIAAILGFKGSLSARMATISACFVLLVPQCYGKVDHYHVLWWASVILAWSPAWEVWSIDSWVKETTNGISAPAPGTTTPFKGLFWLWLLVIMAYSFPGLWKWAWNGPLWATPQSMKAIAYNQWALLQKPPYWKPDSDLQWGLLSALVLIFELGFPLALLNRRLRKYLIAFAWVFHLGVWLTMGIAFWHLGLVLVILWPLSTSNSEVITHDIVNWKSIWAKVVAVFLFCGLFYIDTWPFGVYPGFSAALTNQVQTITLRKSQKVAWEMYQSEWGVGKQTINPSRRLGIVTQITRADTPLRMVKLRALRDFLSTGPDSLMFRDKRQIFNLDLKMSGPKSPY